MGQYFYYGELRVSYSRWVPYKYESFMARVIDQFPDEPAFESVPLGLSDWERTLRPFIQARRKVLVRDFFFMETDTMERLLRRHRYDVMFMPTTQFGGMGKLFLVPAESRRDLFGTS